jgi:hypothetical protein
VKPFSFWDEIPCGKQPMRVKLAEGLILLSGGGRLLVAKR